MIVIAPKELARVFSFVLSEWLSREQVDEINRRNATEEYAHCCATHDFCDANQAMLDALASLGIESYDETLNPLINAAWKIAKSDRFRVTVVD